MKLGIFIKTNDTTHERNAPDNVAESAHLRKIPASLIYEEIDGVPYYYRGYRSVLSR